MSRPILMFSQSDYLIQVVDIHSNTEWQTLQIQISSEANWSGSIMFAIAGHIRVQQDMFYYCDVLLIELGSLCVSQSIAFLALQCLIIGRGFSSSKVNEWPRELILADPHQAPDTKGKGRQIQLGIHKMNRWQAELATLSQKVCYPNLTEYILHIC